MRIKFCCLAVLCLVSPVWAAQQDVTICVNNNSDTLDAIFDLPSACASGNAAVIKWEHNDKPLNVDHPDVTKAIIVVHDAGETPFNTTAPPAAYAAILGQIGTPNETTWLVAPDFVSGSSPLGAARLRWKSNVQETSGQWGYAMGNASTAPTGLQVSSFSLMDHLIKRMKVRAPNITEFVIVGFGVGAEFVNRYSIATRIDDPASSSRVQGASVRYLMASADRYMYLTNRRFDSPVDANGNPIENQTRPITDTSINTDCNNDPDIAYYYDKYPYGVGVLLPNHYVSGSSTQLKNRVKRKPRLFLVGSGDSASTDSGCAASEQGPNRRNRAIVYAHHMRFDDFAENAGLCVIRDALNNQDIGYDPSKMLGSHAAMFYWKFGTIHCAVNDPVDCVPTMNSDNKVVCLRP